jgi:hypothetical protein
MVDLAPESSISVEDVDRKCATALAIEFAAEAYFRPVEIRQFLYKYRPVEEKELTGDIRIIDRKVGGSLARNYGWNLIELAEHDSDFVFAPKEKRG